MRRSLAALAAATAAALLAVAGCSSGSDSASATTKADKPTLVLYNAQHEDVGKAWADGFTKATGIKVDVRNGSDFEMANQIVAEGKASPADVFITENSPAMSLLSSKSLFAPVDAATKAQVPARYASSAGDWVGVAARSTVYAYHTGAPMPKSILDLAKPEWKGKFGISPSGADFQAIVSAVYAVEGDAAATTWLKGIKTNGKIYRGNTAILQAVNAGQVQGGVIYHYYWFNDQADGGKNSNNTKLEYFGHQDPGAFVSVSGGGVLKSSKHQAEAQQFLAYMSGKTGQEMLSAGTAMEYSVGNNVPANPKLTPLDQLDSPNVDLNTLNGPKVISEMQQVGLL
ncbi:iron ABC transporter substrate-binding protein [Actinoplanes sp. TBRC 11911]|uniref:iron ABC transporter substrate-binding protein n=1 Tax=Actinoplanes sp. TBRC 11911 TaxID=2729386 RepID=UPI00145E67C4|nr:iron ABC transporter substrate-binding protein [Actinoplanes sp. TBRC 11911]NMO56905.1 iron ABC transporter substrate-binding protein [Actinoplanes sp. TBRC 11911]